MDKKSAKRGLCGSKMGFIRNVDAVITVLCAEFCDMKEGKPVCYREYSRRRPGRRGMEAVPPRKAQWDQLTCAVPTNRKA